MNKKKLLPAAGLILLIVAAALIWLNWPDGGEAPTIALTGNIEMTEVDVAFKFPGRIVELTVEEGDEVEKGALLARLDDEQLRWQRRQAVASLEASRSRIRELETRILFQQESMEGQVRQRQAELEQARARLKELETGARPQEVEQARAAVQRAEARFGKARSDWEMAQSLFHDQDISRAQHDQFKSAYESAEANLRQSREQLSLVLEGARAEDREAARAQLARAEAGLDLARALGLDVRRSRQSLATLAADVKRAEAAVEQLKSQLDDSVVASPIDGVVLVKNAEEGEVIAAGVPVLTLGDVDRPWLRGYIPEESLGRVKLGDRVRVATDSFPGKEYWGEVAFISSQAEFTPKQIQTPEERVKLVYRIKVNVDNPNRELKLNMPCDAVVFLDE